VFNLQEYFYLNVFPIPKKLRIKYNSINWRMRVSFSIIYFIGDHIKWYDWFLKYII